MQGKGSARLIYMELVLTGRLGGMHCGSRVTYSRWTGIRVHLCCRIKFLKSIKHFDALLILFSVANSQAVWRDVYFHSK